MVFISAKSETPMLSRINFERILGQLYVTSSAGNGAWLRIGAATVV